MWTFGTAKGTTWLQRLYWWINLRTMYRWIQIKATNELEDIPVQRWDRLDPTAPQKLGANDAPIIIWRRRLPLTSRDNVRVWKKGLDATEEAEAEAQRLEAEPETVQADD
jgi:hypothetical protein